MVSCDLQVMLSSQTFCSWAVFFLFHKYKASFSFEVVHDLNLIDFKGEYFSIFKDRSRGEEGI